MDGWGVSMGATAMAISLKPLGGVGRTSSPTATWDPATTGGLASQGPFGLPWVPVLAWILLVGAVTIVVHLRNGGKIRGPWTWAPWSPEDEGRRTGWSPRLRLWVWMIWVVPFLVLSMARDWDPLSAADPIAPGPNVVAVLDDGQWDDDSIESAASWSSGGSEPCLSECPGPRYIYALQPGDRYWWLATVRNDGPLPITLLGRPGRDAGLTRFGLALLRDPSSLSATAGNLRPFEPVSLAPGATVTVAVVGTADTCANPAADTRDWQPYATAYPLVFEVLGWRRVGDIWPHVSVTVAGCAE